MLADPASVHTIKWANALCEREIDVFLFGFDSCVHESYNKNIKIETAGYSREIKNKPDGALSKIIYLRSLSLIKAIIRDFEPDILHSHYASSYGLAGALTSFHPFVVSVWGSDIYNFPAKSIIHKQLTKFLLNRADKVLSTSNIMAERTKKFTGKDVVVTPFGIDVNKYKPGEKANVFGYDNIIIGTIKTLEEKYGVEYLIRAFKIVKEKLSHLLLKLLIVGGGSTENKLKKLVKELNIDGDVLFTGFINPSDIPKFHNAIDIYAALSTDDSESFGVAILESSACEKPVVVSNVGGLKEIVDNNKTGLIVEPRNIQQTADAIEKLILDKELRVTLGKNGRSKVIKEYNWDDNVEQMISIYKNILDEKSF